jgi:hypothetical protein
MRKKILNAFVLTAMLSGLPYWLPADPPQQAPYYQQAQNLIDQARRAEQAKGASASLIQSYQSAAGQNANMLNKLQSSAPVIENLMGGAEMLNSVFGGSGNGGGLFGGPNTSIPGSELNPQTGDLAPDAPSSVGPGLNDPSATPAVPNAVSVAPSSPVLPSMSSLLDSPGSSGLTTPSPATMASPQGSAGGYSSALDSPPDGTYVPVHAPPTLSTPNGIGYNQPQNSGPDGTYVPVHPALPVSTPSPAGDPANSPQPSDNNPANADSPGTDPSANNPPGGTAQNPAPPQQEGVQTKTTTPDGETKTVTTYPGHQITTTTPINSTTPRLIEFDNIP